MPPIVKSLLILIGSVIVIVIGFRTHWAIGLLLIALILIAGLYASRSNLYAQRGNIAFMKGDQDKALALLEKASRSKSAQPQHLIGYAFLLMKAGNPAKAEQVLNGVIAATKLESVRMQANMNLSTAYWLQGKQEEAVNLLEQVLQNFKNTVVYGNLGYFKILQGKLDEALEINQEAYEFNDNDVTILDNLAQNYLYLGRLEEAEQMYVKLMAKSPKHAETYYYYAQTLEKLGKPEAAREQIAMALEKPLALVTALTREEIEQAAERLG